MSRGHVRELARRIVRLGQQPVEFNGLSLEARTHAGVAHFPDHSTDPNDLLINASAAKRVAHGGSSGYMEYEVEHAVRVERFTLASDLKRAIDEDQLILHYQPKLHLETNEICSAEALMRWNHPTRGMVPPGEFIGLAEQTGLISRLTYWAVAEALRQTEEWRRQGLSIGVSINVSAKDLSRPDFFSVVRRSLLENKTPYEGCMLEVTESTMMRNPEANIDILTQLRAIGVHSSIDDFGTGYSSLAYLTRMPVAELKIDRAFVGDMLTNKQNALIVSSTISLAHALGLAVTAEGVEDAQTGEALKDLGCDIVQGYGISRPVDAEAFCKWCRARAQAL